MSYDYLIQKTDANGKVSYYHESGAWRDFIYHGTYYKAVTANKIVRAFASMPRATFKKVLAPPS